jgi:hypothetical protein
MLGFICISVTNKKVGQKTLTTSAVNSNYAPMNR